MFVSARTHYKCYNAVSTSYPLWLTARRDEVLLYVVRPQIWHPVLCLSYIHWPDIWLISDQPNAELSHCCHRAWLEKNLNGTWSADKCSWVWNVFKSTLLQNALTLRRSLDSFNKINWWVHKLDIYFNESGEDNFWPACGMRTKKITVY